MKAISLILSRLAAFALVLLGVGCCSADRLAGISGAVGNRHETMDLRIRLIKNLLCIRGPLRLKTSIAAANFPLSGSVQLLIRRLVPKLAVTRLLGS